MSLKFVFLICAIAVATAIEIQQPLLLKSQAYEIEEGPAEYEFSYSVHDEHTGDIKAQKEIRKGDKVEGSYELIDSDGYRRLVQYRSDKHSGFEAVVHREPTSIKIPIPEIRQKLIATKILASPAVHYSQQPIQQLVRSDSKSIGLEGSDVGYGNQVSYSGPGVSYNY